MFVGSNNVTGSNPQRKARSDRRVWNSASQLGSGMAALPDGMDGNVDIVLHGDQGPVLSGALKVHGRTRAYVVPSNKNSVVLFT